MSKIEIQKVVEKMDLKNLTPDVGLADKYVEVPDINRPALQLTGFFDHFDAERVQIIGYVEYTFLEQMDPETKRRVYETLLAYKIPCIIFCRDLKPDKELLEKALELYASKGLAVREEGRWRLTPRGLLLSNQIIGVLLELQERSQPLTRKH